MSTNVKVKKFEDWPNGLSSNDNLSAIIENTTDMVYSLDRELRFIIYNNHFKQTLKHAFGFEVTPGSNARDILKYFNADEVAKWKDVYKKALSGQTVEFATQYQFPEGRVWLSHSLNPIRENEHIMGLSCISHDITQQKSDEEALKISEANLLAIIENTTDLVYSLDKNLRYITFNTPFKNKMKSVFNWEVKQGDRTLTLLEGIDPEEAKDWEKIYNQALSGQTMQFVKVFYEANARVFVNFSINPIWDTGKVIGLSCFSRDITQQKLDEEALKKSEASLRTIFENTDKAYLLIDADSKIRSFNTLAQRFSEEQNQKKLVEGASVFNYFSKERQGAIADALNRAKKGEIVKYQINHQSNGIAKWFDITWVGVKNEHNEDLGYLLTNKEITGQKKSEMEREKITADLLQRNKDLEQFTYIISHNLRAPAANIIGLSSLLGDLDPTDAECLEVISGIGVSANKLDGVISDLNQILQINSQVNEHIQPVFLSLLIKDIQISISSLINQENVTIVYDFTTAEVMHTLKSYLHSIFYNLILNSIKYRKLGIAPVITIKSKIYNNKMIINYQDNGRGIDIIKNAKNLFGLYKRFDTSVEGKGMGLFMVKMQVESLGGSITLQSEIDKGARFELRFPLSYLQERLAEH